MEKNYENAYKIYHIEYMLYILDTEFYGPIRNVKILSVTVCKKMLKPGYKTHLQISTPDFPQHYQQNLPTHCNTNPNHQITITKSQPQISLKIHLYIH